MDLLLTVTFAPCKVANMYLSYRYKRKERDNSGTNGSVILPVYQHRLRYRLNYSARRYVCFRTTADYNHFHAFRKPPSQGYQFSTGNNLRTFRIFR